MEAVLRVNDAVKLRMIDKIIQAMGGEVEGKESAQMLVRDLAAGRHRELAAPPDDDVATISRYSRARYFISEKMLTPAPTRRIAPRTRTMKRESSTSPRATGRRRPRSSA